MFCAQGLKANCEMKSITATELLKQYKQETKALMDRRKKPDSTDSALSPEPNVGRGQRGSSSACPQLGRGLKEGDSVILDELPKKWKNSDAQAQKNLVRSDNCDDFVIDMAANECISLFKISCCFDVDLFSVRHFAASSRHCYQSKGWNCPARSQCCQKGKLFEN